jgi:hypothetical protein
MPGVPKGFTPLKVPPPPVLSDALVLAADLPDNSQAREALRASRAGDREAVARLLSPV